MDIDQKNLFYPKRETTLFFRREEQRKKLFKDFLKSSRILPWFICCLIILAHIFLLTPQRLERAENFFFDAFFRIRPNLETTQDIAYIEIAEDSLQVFGRWPWPRQVHATLVHILKAWGAKAIVFDIVFSEPSTEFDDGAFEEALKETAASSTKIYLPLLLESVDGGKIWIHSLPRFEQYAAGLGHIQMTPDRDGLMRRIEPFISYKNEAHPQLGLTVISDLLKEEGRGSNLTTLPLDSNGNFIVNWTGRWQDTFQHYSFLDVLRSFEANQNGKKPMIEAEQFKNKICIIGVTAAGLTDIKPNPLESVYPAVGLYGNIINNLLNKQFLQPVPKGINGFILIILGFIAAFLFIPFRNFISFGKGLGLVFSWAAISFLFFWKAGLWLYMFQHIALVLILFLFCAMYSFFFMEKEKKAFYDLAAHDGLTGLLTIRHFRQLLNEAAREASKNNEKLGLILMDIDNFKNCNDTYGHLMGDEVLKSVAQIVDSCAKNQCTAARYGGEELILLIHGLKEIDQAVQYAEWIRENVEKKKITFGETTISVTLSLGVAILKEENIPDGMIRRADHALYHAKNLGKNRVCVG